MLKKKLTVYSHMAKKQFKRQLKKLGVQSDVQVHRLGVEHDSHIVDDLPLTLSRDPAPGFRIQDEALQ
jgi:hypothetical protein